LPHGLIHGSVYDRALGDVDRFELVELSAVLNRGDWPYSDGQQGHEKGWKQDSSRKCAWFLDGERHVYAHDMDLQK
jgi:hypothetical protein